MEALLYLTTHRPGDGGELVVGHNKRASSIEEVDKDCTTIYPVAGNLILFDAREYPHYVRPLGNDTDTRIVAAMNYYTGSADESKRPQDLDAHLYGEPDDRRD